MNIIHDEDDLRFYADIEGEEAELTYTKPIDTVMDFDYTFVPKKARGKGVADQLVKAGLSYAKKQGYTVIPSCPVVDNYITMHPEYQSIINTDGV